MFNCYSSQDYWDLKGVTYVDFRDYCSGGGRASCRQQVIRYREQSGPRNVFGNLTNFLTFLFNVENECNVGGTFRRINTSTVNWDAQPWQRIVVYCIPWCIADDVEVWIFSGLWLP